MNQTRGTISRLHWRIDGYRPVGAPETRYEFCRAYNSPCGPLWCEKQAEERADVAGHWGAPVAGCIKQGRFTAHGCCRCGGLGHSWSECTVRDAALPSTDQEAVAMPARELEDRREHKQFKKERYSNPQQTSWRGRRNW